MVDHEKYETVIGLVEQYSPSGEDANVVAWLVERMKMLGFNQAYEDETGNAIGVMGTGDRQVVLLGHIDTVPGEIDVRVTSGPNGAVLYGRGTVDAKGPLAAFVDAVAELGAVEGIQFVVIGAIDEERDSLGARGILDQYQPDFAIIGEPSQWNRVTLGYKGSAWADVTVRRSMSHTAGQAESAPEAAVDFWNHVIAWSEDFNKGRERLFDQVLPTLRGFSSRSDGFEDTAGLKLGVRLPLALSPSAWYDQLGKLGSDARVEIARTGFPIPAYRAERNTALVRAFLGGIRSESGRPGFVVKTGTADLNIVAPTWGCPAVAYGPGDSNLDHTPNEHILLSEYDRAVAVLLAVLQRLCP
ncbi:[LysW]-lysine hydrolase [Chloroflexota bacterium]